MTRILVETGKPGKALALAQAGLRKAPDNLALLETVGIAQLETSRFKEAVVTFTRITELSPNAIPAFASLARAAYSAGNATRAKEALKVILRTEPNHQDALVLLIQIALFEQDLDSVRTHLQSLKNIKGTETIVADIETNLALAENKPKEAVVALKKLVELREDTNDTLRLSELLWGLGQRPEALTQMRGWLEKYPNDQITRFKLAQFLMMAANWKEARPVLEKIVSMAPGYLAAMNNLAYVLYKVGDSKAALEFARRANKGAPGDPALMDTLGVILLAEGKADEAVTILRRAAGRPSNSQASIQYHFAKALAATGQNQEAVKLLTKVLDGNRRFDEIEDAKSLRSKLEQ